MERRVTEDQVGPEVVPDVELLEQAPADPSIEGTDGVPMLYVEYDDEYGGGDDEGEA